jgi:hypothetical protein
VTGSDGKEPDDLAALHRDQAGLFLDKSLDLRWVVEVAWVDGHDGADVFCPRCAQLSHVCSIGYPEFEDRPNGRSRRPGADQPQPAP